MAESNDQEKTLPATPKRLEQAREEGNVPRSRELATCLVLLGAAGAFWMMGPRLATQFSGQLQTGLRLDRAAAFDPSLMTTRLAALTFDSLWIVLPVLGLLLLASLAGPLAIGGWLFSSKAFSPQFSRLDPMSGFGRMFSANSLAELVKAIAKAALIGVIGGVAIWGNFDNMIGLLAESPKAGMADFSRLMVWAFMILSAGLIVIALIDVPYQLWHYHKGLRMSLEEYKREARESEGDPQLKAHIRSQQREMARKRMMAEVPNADVVVTNPTHFAVALKYQDGSMRAPQVVAKGADLVAQKIRELAAKHGVPTLEAPPLARALFRHAEIGDEIPPALYNAVAQVLAYVHHLRHFMQFGGTAPQTPSELEVPAGMDIVEGAA